MEIKSALKALSLTHIDTYKGVVAYVRLMEGSVKISDSLKNDATEIHVTTSLNRADKVQMTTSCR